MKFLTISSTLIALVAAAPTSVVLQEDSPALKTRQSSTTRNELENGSSSSCPDGILIYARGSTEAGNMGEGVGPLLATNVAKQVPSLWVQGVGGAYTAGLIENLLPRGTSEAAIDEAVRLFNLATTKCPALPSQGAALIAAAVSDLSATVREQVKGAVLFGYTKNKQNNGQIPNYPADRTAIYCAEGDLVCEGTLTIAPSLFI
uniref:cutinase n=1 Tax=Bionectria ochroleuca TaxID=29856 RepID=A0A8H7KAA3_BIOOC